MISTSNGNHKIQLLYFRRVHVLTSAVGQNISSNVCCGRIRNFERVFYFLCVLRGCVYHCINNVIPKTAIRVEIYGSRININM